MQIVGASPQTGDDRIQTHAELLLQPGRQLPDHRGRGEARRAHLFQAHEELAELRYRLPRAIDGVVAAHRTVVGIPPNVGGMLRRALSGVDERATRAGLPVESVPQTTCETP